MEFLIKREAKILNLENSRLSHITKNEQACLEKMTKGVAKRPFDKKIGMCMKQRFNQPPQEENGNLSPKGRRQNKRTLFIGLLEIHRRET